MKRFFVALLAACGSASTSTVVEIPPTQDLPPPPPPATVQVVAAPSLMRAGEEWVGRYVCAQGETDLDLHIDRVMGDSLEATFEFSHGPSGAGGSYKMRGTIAPNGQVTLTPGAWIDRPSGYMSVGMHGDVRGTRFAGRMDHESCTTFDLRRR
jgi:hypothetical protein